MFRTNMDMIGMESIVRSSLSFYFKNSSIVLAVLRAELRAYVLQTRIRYIQTYIYVPQTRVCYMQSYVYVLQNRICYAQSSKCTYDKKFRKNFGELFHNFEEDF